MSPSQASECCFELEKFHPLPFTVDNPDWAGLTDGLLLKYRFHHTLRSFTLGFKRPKGCSKGTVSLFVPPTPADLGTPKGSQRYPLQMLIPHTLSSTVEQVLWQKLNSFNIQTC